MHGIKIDKAPAPEITATSSVEDVMEWISSFEDLKHLAELVKNSSINGVLLLDINSTDRLVEIGIKRDVERTRLLAEIQLVRQSRPLSTRFTRPTSSRIANKVTRRDKAAKIAMTARLTAEAKVGSLNSFWSFAIF